MQWMVLCSLLLGSPAPDTDLDVPYLGLWQPPLYAIAPSYARPEVRAASVSRAFVAAHVHPNVVLEDLEFVTTPQGDILHQVQTLGGVPVDGTQGVVQLRGDRVRFARYHVMPPQPRTAEARVTGDEARHMVQSIFAPAHLGSATLRWRRAAGSDVRLVWRVPMTLNTPPGDWAVDIDAVDGAYITRTSLDVNAVEGEVVAPVERRCQGDKPQLTALPYVKWAEDTYADSSGGFASAAEMPAANVELTSPYIELRDLRAPLSGPWNVQLVSAPAHNTLSLDNPIMSHVDAYYALHHVRDWLAGREQLTERQREWANRKVLVNVNVSGHCNAFYSTYQESLNFYPAGRGCIDSARSQQAVFHEYGHALMFHSTPGDLDVTQALGEGYGDVVATFASGVGVMGDIEPNCDATMRTCLNKLTFCRKGCDYKGWRHAYKSAQVVCGAWWDMRASFIERYGEEEGARRVADLFVRHLPLVSGDMPDTYAAAIAADDDDNDNPRDGTAHSCEINSAYSARFPDLRPTLVRCVR